MKQLFIISALAIILLAFGKIVEDKKYKVELSQQDWSNRYVWVTVAMQQLKKSNLPAGEILPLCDSLQKFTNELAAQLQPQFVADTTKKKSK
jgi:hypothetical protein